MIKENEQELFWSDDISVLFDWDKLAEIIPKSEMNSKQKLNAISRLIIYGGIITYLFQMDSMTILVSVVGLFITYLLNKNIEEFKEESNLDEEEVRSCKKVTQNNPFMNVLPTDYENPQRLKECSHLDSKTRKKIREAFEKRFPRDSDDIFGRNNSFRQFYTMPSTTIPNSRDKLQKWLYNSRETCKEGGILPKK